MSWTCPDHGEYDDAILGTCPDCDRLRRDAEHQLDQPRRCWLHWRDRSGVPARFRNRTVANWIPQSGQESAAKVVHAFTGDLGARLRAGDGLTLLGPPGLGKTHLLTALVSAACAAGFPAHYASWPDLLTRARGAAKANSASNPLGQAAAVPLLAIDELALGTSTQWAADAMFELFDQRYREGRSTLVASNATSADLADTVGERLADRLREMNSTLLLAGESMRDRVAVAGPPAFPEPPETVQVRVCERGVMRTISVRTSVESGHARRALN